MAAIGKNYSSRASAIEQKLSLKKAVTRTLRPLNHNRKSCPRSTEGLSNALALDQS